MSETKYVKTRTVNGLEQWETIPSLVSGSMVYPGAGIALSTGSAWGSSITNNSANWNTAYTDRLKWDGGATDLVAATGRTSLGATTVGAALFMLANPSAITFIRVNADNSVSALSAGDFKTALSLQNVTNESKATMFTDPTFTGTVNTTTIHGTTLNIDHIGEHVGSHTIVFDNTITFPASTIVPDGGTIGQAAGPLLTFDDTLNYLEITGCNVAIGTTSSTYKTTIHRGTAGAAFVPDTYSTWVAAEITANADAQYAATGILFTPEFGGGKGAGIVAIDPQAASWGGVADLAFITASGNVSYERMRILSGGNVGIGTAAPNAKLESLSTTEQLRLSYDATHYATFTVGAAGDMAVLPKDFVTGFIASGGNSWQITSAGNAEFENMLIRGGLSVYELIINRLHYQNGSLVLGHGAGKVKTIDDATLGAEVITMEDPAGTDIVPFTAGSIVMIQNVDLNRTDVVKKIVRQVASVSGSQITFEATAGWTPAVNDVGSFAVGDEVCALGHTTTAALQNSIFMTAIEADNPYLKVVTEVDSYADWSATARIKLMLGNLASIASQTYGSLTIPASPGYGFFSDNCYLSGTIVASAGLIGGFTIDSTEGLYAGTGATRVQMKAGAGFWAGATAIEDAPFSVTEEGSLKAIGATELGTAVNLSGYGFSAVGNDIYEGSYNGDASVLNLNLCGYAGGFTKYRRTVIGDGKNNAMIEVQGDTSTVGIWADTLSITGIVPIVTTDSLIYAYTIGDTPLISHDAESTSVSTTYTKVKTIKLGANVRTGRTIRIKFSIKSVGGLPYAYGRIYINGVAAGTERSTSSTSYVEYSEDIAGIDASDEVQLYVKVTDTETVSYKNFRICGSHATYANEITGTTS